MEFIAELIERNSIFLNGFLMTGVILILVGLKNVTMSEMREYRLSHTNIHKMDEVIAWGVFYIIFGVLISAGALISIYPYLT